MKIIGRRDLLKEVAEGSSGGLRFVLMVAKEDEEGPEHLSNQPETLLVLLEGDMNRNAIPTLRKRIGPRLGNNGTANVLVDLEKVSNIDTAGVATLIDWLEQCKKENIGFTLAGPTPEVQTLLARHHSKDIFEVIPPLQWVIS